MNHRGIEFTVAKTAIPGIWQWQFRIGDQIKTGKTETKIDLLAIRRVQLRIDRELKAMGASRPEAAQHSPGAAGPWPPPRPLP